tara:strand:+ start:7274 stop:8191 length:918 start_codon:yes stop_codon:yes gene_type:complete
LKNVKNKNVLCTSVHSGSIYYLNAWWSSVINQTTHDFDIVISVDGFDFDLDKFLKGHEQFNIQLFYFNYGRTISEIRNKIIEYCSENYDKVIFVDTDDVLDKYRVAKSLDSLDAFDFTFCKTYLIDEKGNSLPWMLKKNSSINDICEFNSFGLSNSNYKSYVLKEILPIPKNCEIIDWFISTFAFLYRYKFAYIDETFMKYRIYAQNVTKVIPPYNLNDLNIKTKYVLNHFDFIMNILAKTSKNVFENDIEIFKQRHQLVQNFYFKFFNDIEYAKNYVNLLNKYYLENNVREISWWNVVANSKIM